MASRAPASSGGVSDFPPRRKSTAVVNASACSTCHQATGTEICKGGFCTGVVCINCIGPNERCTSCDVIRNLNHNMRNGGSQQQVVSKFAAFFKSKKPRTGEYARTPDRGQGMDVPMSASKGGLFGFLRRTSSSSSSRNLSAFLEAEERSQSPLPNSNAGAGAPRPPRSAPRPSTAASIESSDEAMRKLNAELERLRELNEKYEVENERIRNQLESRSHSGSNTSTTSSGTEQPQQLSVPELNEAKARVVDLQVQVQEARDEIFRIGAELLNTRERERQLEEYVNAVLAARAADASNGGGGSRARSAVPPCVPLPNSAESREWLASIRQGTYEDYWATAAASVIVSGGSSSLPLPPPPSSSSSQASQQLVGANGKKRSDIPPPPPLPAGMLPLNPANQVFSAAGAAAMQGRRGSAPGLLETGPHQKKCESVFASVGTAKPDLKPLFWAPLDQNKVQGTIFEKLTEKPVVRPDAMDRQIKTLVSRFAKRAPKGGAAASSSSSSTQAAQQQQQQAPRLAIMDPKRKQQIGIGLSGSFRNISLLELKKAIVNLDSHVLTLDRVKMLLEMIPTQEEIKALDEFRSGGLLDGNFFAGMSKEETFFTDMAAIPRLKQRLLCACMEISFESSLTQLAEDLDTFGQAVAVVRDSQRWKEFLALCLETGNYLNEGNNGLGGAWGFSLKEGLKKFSEMKSCENNSRFSLMHWIAEVAAAHKTELFGMVEEFGPVSDASMKSVEELKAEVGTIKRQLDIVKGEVEKSKLESSEGSTKFLQRMVPFLDNVLLVQYAKLQASIDEIEKSALSLVVSHGESPQQTSCQQLFHIILEGISAFLKCHEENQALKHAEQKQMLQQQNSARKLEDKASATASSGLNGAAGGKRDQNNRILKDTGLATGQGKQELELAMAKRRRAPPQ